MSWFKAYKGFCRIYSLRGNNLQVNAKIERFLSVNCKIRHCMHFPAVSHLKKIISHFLPVFRSLSSLSLHPVTSEGCKPWGITTSHKGSVAAAWLCSQWVHVQPRGQGYSQDLQWVQVFPVRVWGSSVWGKHSGSFSRFTQVWAIRQKHLSQYFLPLSPGFDLLESATFLDSRATCRARSCSRVTTGS